MFVILGPTSSGKSDYAINLAKEIGGEVISVDSRQVYRGMDVGTGKVLRDFSGKSKIKNQKSKIFSGGVRHWLLDVASPKREYNVTHFLRDAKKAITDIERRGKVPILCGGTTFWAEALLLGTYFPEVKPDKKLRAKLGKCSAEELFKLLETKDPERAETIDPHNKVRLIRALEIVASIGKVPALPVNSQQLTVNKEIPLPCHPELVSGSPHHLELPFLVIPIRQLADEGSQNLSARDSSTHGLAQNDIKIIILNPEKEILHERIEKRLKDRLEEGMIDEVRRLREEGVSWKRLEGFGLEYRWCARFLQGKISRDDLVTGLLSDIKHYAKRQLTFLRRLERSGFNVEWI